MLSGQASHIGLRWMRVHCKFKRWRRSHGQINSPLVYINTFQWWVWRVQLGTSELRCNKNRKILVCAIPKCTANLIIQVRCVVRNSSQCTWISILNNKIGICHTLSEAFSSLGCTHKSHPGAIPHNMVQSLEVYTLTKPNLKSLLPWS